MVSRHTNKICEMATGFESTASPITYKFVLSPYVTGATSRGSCLQRSRQFSRTGLLDCGSVSIIRSAAVSGQLICARMFCKIAQNGAAGTVVDGQGAWCFKLNFLTSLWRNRFTSNSLPR